MMILLKNAPNFNWYTSYFSIKSYNLSTLEDDKLQPTKFLLILDKQNITPNF